MELIKFSNGNEVKFIKDKYGKFWFFSEQVAMIMGYKDTINVIETYVNNKYKCKLISLFKSDHPYTVLINYYGLMQLFMKSRIEPIVNEKTFFTGKYLNPNVKCNTVKDNSDIEWGYTRLSTDYFTLEIEDPNVIYETLKLNSDNKWIYCRLVKDSDVVFDMVELDSNGEWNHYHLHKDKNITWDIVNDNTEKEWDYKRLSKNPNVFLDIVKSNTSVNNMSKMKRYFMDKYKKYKSTIKDWYNKKF